MRIAATMIACLAFAGSSRAETTLPDGQKLGTVDFERHIMGLFSKTGCNNGSCHGSFQGKNGFRLSLFGYDPDKDYAALTRELVGRRVDRNHPDKSLLLEKAIGHVRHEGGVRFSKDSWQYDVFKKWIEDGAPWKAGSGQVAELILEPKEYIFCPKGETKQLKISAKFADGTIENITPFCDFRVSDDAVATITPAGLIKASRAGDCGLIVAYRGVVASARVLVPSASVPGLVYPKAEPKSYIDREVLAKLKMLNVVPSGEASDLEFLRRVTIDTIGCLPTPEEVRAFMADPSADKREKKIDELLKNPLHSAVWATKFSDITGNNTAALENPQQLQTKRSQMWHDWLRKRFQDNVPYDQIVKGILTATSLDGKSPEEWLAEQKRIDENLEKAGSKASSGFDSSLYAARETLDLFWKRQQQVTPEIWGEKVAAAFLGVRLECAQCHKHPTDRWTQNDYRAFANLFAQVQNANANPVTKKLIDAENAVRLAANDKPNNNNVNRIREVYVTAVAPGNKVKNNPETGYTLKPKALGGPEIAYDAGKDVRKDLFQWMVQPDNPFFARSFVNRVWAQYFGVGLVDPVDDFSTANPPSNARLLDALAKDFLEHKFDIRYLEKQILMSRTYQTTSVPNETNKFDKNNYAHAYVRPLLAEVVVDVMNSALGTPEAFGPDYKAGTHMVEVGANRFQNPNLSFVLRIFGQPPRTTACDCERTMDPALPQTLFRMMDDTVLKKLKDPTGRVAKVLKEKKDDKAAAEDIFLAMLTRMPTDKERTDFEEYLAKTKNRETAFTDLAWALLNTREFILNH